MICKERQTFPWLYQAHLLVLSAVRKFISDWYQQILFEIAEEFCWKSFRKSFNLLDLASPYDRQLGLGTTGSVAVRCVVHTALHKLCRSKFRRNIGRSHRLSRGGLPTTSKQTSGLNFKLSNQSPGEYNTSEEISPNIHLISRTMRTLSE